jgi:ATP synthase F1 delta subunit
MKITEKQYAQTLLELTANKPEQEVSNIAARFAEQLKKDGQLKNAAKIIGKFSELYNGAHGIVEAEIVSWEKLDEGMLEKMTGFLKEKYAAKKVEIRNTVDKKIKGGIIIKVGDEVLDGSISRQLKKLKNILSK